ANLVAAPLGEPDDAVAVDLQALRLALGGREELREDAVLGHARDRAIVTEGGEPLVAVLAGDDAIGAAKVTGLELLGLRIEHRDRRTAARPDPTIQIDAHGMRAGVPTIRQRRVLMLGDLLGIRLQLSDAAGHRFGEPDSAVG